MTQKEEHLEEAGQGFLDVDPEEVLEKARAAGLNVSSLEDFRKQADQYERIERVMNDYTATYARYSAVGGITTGIGGITTSITLGGLEMASTAVQLYRLSQRFAILNGFDPRHPLHKDKIYSIYLNTLGFKAAVQSAIKFILFRASSGKKRSFKEQLITSVVTRIARKVGSNVSKSKYSKLVPLVGGAVGAYSGYTYAHETGNTMRDAFKEYYFAEWHDAEAPEEN